MIIFFLAFSERTEPRLSRNTFLRKLKSYANSVRKRADRQCFKSSDILAKDSLVDEFSVFSFIFVGSKKIVIPPL